MPLIVFLSKWAQAQNVLNSMVIKSHTQKKLGPSRIWDYVMRKLIIYYGLFKWGKHTFELDLTKGNRPFSIVVEKVVEHHCILTWSMFSIRKGYCLNKN